MARSHLALVLLAAGVAACGAGCTTCASPNDYCGPVYNGGCEPCIINQRVGSILDDPGVGPIPNTSPLVKGRKGPAGAGGINFQPFDDGPIQYEDGELPPSSDTVQPPSARVGPNLRR